MNLYRLITFIAIISLGLASNTANAGDGHHQARGFKGKLVSNYHYGKKRYHHSKKRYYHGKKHFRGDYYNHFHKKKYRKFKKKRAYKHYYGHHYSPYHYKKRSIESVSDTVTTTLALNAATTTSIWLAVIF